MSRLLRILVVAGIIVASVQDGEILSAQPLDRTEIEALKSSDFARSGHVLQKLEKQRQAAIETLLIAAHYREIDVQTKADIFELLGRYRAESAFGLLFEHLEFAPRYRSTGEDGPLAHYPAAQALANIGDLAAGKIAEYLGRHDQPVPPVRLTLIAFVLYEIDGKQLGYERLRIAREEAKEQDAKENFSRLMALFKATDFTDPHTWPRP